MSDEVVVSDKELKQVENEVKQQEANKEKEIADKVRAELEQEQKTKKLAEEKAALEKKLAEQEEALKRSKEEQESAMNKLVEQRLKEELTKRKAIVPPPSTGTTTKQLNVDPQDIDGIEMASYEAFRRRSRGE